MLSFHGCGQQLFTCSNPLSFSSLFCHSAISLDLSNTRRKGVFANMYGLWISDKACHLGPNVWFELDYFLTDSSWYERESIKKGLQLDERKSTPGVNFKHRLSQQGRKLSQFHTTLFTLWDPLDELRKHISFIHIRILSVLSSNWSFCSDIKVNVGYDIWQTVTICQLTGTQEVKWCCIVRWCNEGLSCWETQSKWTWFPPFFCTYGPPLLSHSISPL